MLYLKVLLVKIGYGKYCALQVYSYIQKIHLLKKEQKLEKLCYLWHIFIKLLDFEEYKM